MQRSRQPTTLSSVDGSFPEPRGLWADVHRLRRNASSLMCIRRKARLLEGPSISPRPCSSMATQWDCWPKAMKVGPPRLKAIPIIRVHRGRPAVRMRCATVRRVFSAQASILTLYDPDRSQSVTHLGNVSTWAAFSAAFLQFIRLQAPANEGRGLRLRVLTEAVTSPTLGHQLAQLLDRFPRGAVAHLRFDWP